MTSVGRRTMSTGSKYTPLASLVNAYLAALVIISCHRVAPSPAVTPMSAHASEASGAYSASGAPIDRHATPETRALFANLRRLEGTAVLFGHQNPIAPELVGVYPAVYGWEVAALWWHPEGTDSLRERIIANYRSGGIITMSWHMNNLATHKNFYDTTVVTPQLLPGGSLNAAYRGWLDTAATFFQSLRSGDTLIPVVFRPFHEMTGGWFWWGRRHTTPAQLVALWRFTVEYLRDVKGVHNLLYAYSTDVFDSPADYLLQWPGDAYVDVLGFDDYHSVKSPDTRDVFVRRLHDVVTMADARHKIPALTETGVDSVPDPNWWTGTLLSAITTDSITRRIAWLLVWSNGGRHFYTPNASQSSAADFVRFYQNPLIRFQDNLPDLYHLGSHPSDREATPETRALFAGLKRVEGTKILLGHHDDLAYGVTWKDEPGRSDVKDVAGAYPALVEWECGNLEKDMPADLDGVTFDQIRQFALQGYGRGEVVALSWHMSNPVTGGNAWDTTSAASAILPGGERHEAYTQWLDRFAEYLGTFQRDGRPIPIIFRPFHEMTGGWFWWGRRHTTPAEYIALYRFTVSYLRDTKHIHNLLYAYTPDVFESTSDYLLQYPGDAYVDIMGYDDYKSIKSPDTRPTFVQQLHELVELADAHGKVPALTETGVLGMPDSTWFTGTLLAGIKSDAVTRRIAYVSLWRNARPDHFFGPWPGSASARDFVRFRHDPLMAFEGDVPDLYRAP
jgi:mannan endo-1,4-beta-mannosidase